jgi:hypothetical protein
MDDNSIADDREKELESEYDDNNDPDYKPKQQGDGDSEEVEALGSEEEIDDENVATAVVVDDNNDDYEIFHVKGIQCCTRSPWTSLMQLLFSLRRKVNDSRNSRRWHGRERNR